MSINDITESCVEAAFAQKRHLPEDITVRALHASVSHGKKETVLSPFENSYLPILVHVVVIFLRILNLLRRHVSSRTPLQGVQVPRARAQASSLEKYK